VPTLTIVAGANGAGKSTMTRFGRELFQPHPVLDPDTTAKMDRVMGSGSGSQIAAARTILRVANELLEKRESFSIETTLSGRTYLKMMRAARKLGYEIRLVYIGTEVIEINLERVRVRVQAGGHDIPEGDQRRRYPRSFANLKGAVELADQAIIFDNSSPEGPRKIAIKDNGKLELFAPIPKWFEDWAL
jgi:predicted ABC-type ATPase